jgi:hypothetical protein
MIEAEGRSWYAYSNFLTCHMIGGKARHMMGKMIFLMKGEVEGCHTLDATTCNLFLTAWGYPMRALKMKINGKV